MDENKNIEEFFKKRLENSDFNYQESDWVMLEQRLDAAAIPGISGVALSPAKLVIIGGIIASVTFMAGWFLHDYFTEADTLTDTPMHVIKDPGTYPKQQRAPFIVVDEASKGAKSKMVSYNEEGTPPTAGNVNINENQESSGAERVLVLASEDVPEEVTSRNQPVRVDRLEAQKHYPVIHATFPDPNAIRQDQKISSTTSYLDEEAVASPARFMERWSLGVVVAPDFNSVGMGSSKTMSALVGGQLYYDVAKRWTISTGILLNRKKYQADGEEYNPPSGWSYQGGATPDLVDGSCKVIDIPVMVSYRWTSNERVNFSSSVGLSNYILLDEKYEFLYGSSYYNTSSYGWSTYENSKLMWGVANLSIAVQFALTPRITATIEPYLKKPLKMVGWGDIDLISTGSLFTLRYRPFID